MIDPTKTHPHRPITVRALDDDESTTRAIVDYLAHSTTPSAERSSTMSVNGRRIAIVRNGAGRVLALYQAHEDGTLRRLCGSEALREAEYIGETYAPPPRL